MSVSILPCYLKRFNGFVSFSKENATMVLVFPVRSLFCGGRESLSANGTFHSIFEDQIIMGLIFLEYYFPPSKWRRLSLNSIFPPSTQTTNLTVDGITTQEFLKGWPGVNQNLKKMRLQKCLERLYPNRTKQRNRLTPQTGWRKEYLR